MNETLDFPEIQVAPPAPSTDVAVAASGVIDLAKIDLADVALAQFGNWRPAVAKLKDDNEKLVLDLSTQSKIDEAISLRHRTINQPKADANKVATALKSKFAQTSRLVGAEVEDLHKAYDEAAAPLTAQITAAQTKLDAEKEAKRKAEAERLQGLRDTVDTIMAGWLARCKVEGITSERITNGIAMFANLAMPSEVADVKAHWVTAYTDTAASMVALRDAAKGREDAAVLEAQRLENERVAAELAEQRRVLNEQAEALRRSQAVIDAADDAAHRRQREEFLRANPPEDLQQTLAPNCHAPESSVAPPAKAADVIPDTPAAPGGDQGASTITQDAQKSGSLPGTPGACASTGAEAAEAPGSGDEGKAAHADERAADTRPPINVGEINRRLGFTVTSAFIKETLGITPEGLTKGGTPLWSAAAWPAICEALIAHIQEKAGE